MRRFTTVLTVAFGLILGSGVSSSQAGVIAGAALEFKGVFQPTVPVRVFTSSMYIKLVSGWGARDGEEHFRLNGERIINIPAGPPILVYNLYPVIIHVPQPSGFADPQAPIDFYCVMATDQGNGIGPLPTGWQEDSATIEDAFGVQHPGNITPISDLSLLPTSSIHDTQIQWDLSQVQSRTGNYYLAQFTMTGMEVPEPAIGLAMPLLLLLVRRVRRWE